MRPRKSISVTSGLSVGFALASLWLLGAGAVEASRRADSPHVILITVDTLRADRLSGYGYERPTSPNLDALFATGVRFEVARTVEPLTGPGLSSMVTSLYPHQHGATRNGVRMREGLPSFTKILQRRGYATAAFVSNWTLSDHVSGLGEHFDVFEPVLTRRRWFFWSGESSADDINEAAMEWLRKRRRADPDQRVALWVHYVEPHGPYEYHEEFAERLGIADQTAGRRNRYDTEVAFVDDRIGRFLSSVEEVLGDEDRLVVFTSDHGESLGEHNYWGHGRHCYEPGLRIPLSFSWPGRIPPGTVTAPALIIDISQTLLGLLGLPTQPTFQGYDWSPVLVDGADPPEGRTSWHQAHRGAVKATSSEQVRQRGLLEVARVAGGTKEILRVTNGNRRLYDLTRDPGEEDSEVDKGSAPSPELAGWLEIVRQGLARSDELPPPVLTDEEIERLRALGYLD